MLNIAHTLNLGFTALSSAFYPSPTFTDVSIAAQKEAMREHFNEVGKLLYMGLQQAEREAEASR